MQIMKGGRPPVKHSTYPRGEGNAAPSWIAFDKQVLCFDGFFHEITTESVEGFKVRRCKIYFHLEDDTVQVRCDELVDVRVQPSPPGTLIRRHRVPLPLPNEDRFYTMEKFNVGCQVELYSKQFQLTGCDDFTRNFLTKYGLKVPDNAQTPDDPYSNSRDQADAGMQPLRPYERVDTLKQFLDHDKHVLRFYCWWDDTCSLFGDQRQMILHYYLADDTIEIKEVFPANAGRDTVPTFLRRCKLPKDTPALPLPGKVADRTVLNVFGPMGHGGRYILDSLKTGSLKCEFYKDSDLTIGTVVSVYGRKFVICDCDEFTKEYYKMKYGVAQFNALNFDKSYGSDLTRMHPPWNGWGSVEDSLGNCLSLIPQPPKKDFKMMFVPEGDAILRFLAQYHTKNGIDKQRRFIISYFMADNTVSVYEQPQGMFCERQRVKRPGQPKFPAENFEYYDYKDIFVGAEIEVNSHKFSLVDADEFAFRFMEDRPDLFPMSNINLLLPKLQCVFSKKQDQLVEFFALNDPDDRGEVRYEQIRDILRQLSEGQINEQEIMTIGRHYMDRSTEQVTMQSIGSICQDILLQKGFEDFHKLQRAFLKYDFKRNGVLDRKCAHKVIRSCRLPLPSDLVWYLLGQEDTVNYEELVNLINWRSNRIPPMKILPKELSHFDEERQSVERVLEVCYKHLLSDVLPQ